jgi:hypothetical protein
VDVVRERAADDGACGPVERPEDTGAALELLVHGVGGATPEHMLDDPRTVRVSGDDTAAVFRRADDVEADGTEGARRDGRPVPEAYVWCNLTSGNGARALWLLLLPFMVVNLAHWMRPSAKGRQGTVRLYGALVRLVGLSLTVLLVATACVVAMDLTAWQCAGTRACAEAHTWLRFASPTASGGGWWSPPGRRLALAAAVPTALVALLWYLSRRTWRTYESEQPVARAEADDTSPTALGRPGFWFGRRLVARLRGAHTAAGLLTVAAALTLPAAAHDRDPGGSAALETLGILLQAALTACAITVVAVVCGRGRSERRLDRGDDPAVVRRLPAAALLLLALALPYAGWDRPEWRSADGLPGDAAFGGIALVQGLLVIVLAVIAHLLYRTGRLPGDRTAMRGLAGPAVALLACALGGVMTGGLSQRVADWLDGTGDGLPGAPVLLTWQASVIPPLLAVLLLLTAWQAWRTRALARAERAAVEAEYAEEARNPERTRVIARVRAMATLTDRGPLFVAVVCAVTPALGAAALIGGMTSGETPSQAARGAHPLVHGAAETAQALGSWFIGIGFLIFVTLGRRAYQDASARRTIGILWDVGTFWPRAAHPFAPPCYAERAVPDLTWRVATWTRATGGRLVISGHSQGSVLAAATAWQLPHAVRKRVALLTYGSPLERLYGRWFPAHFGPESLAALHDEVDCWRNLYRLTDPIGGPVRVPENGGPRVDCEPLKDPLAHGRTDLHPLPAPILGHSDYQADPVFAHERDRLLDRLSPPEVPAQRPTGS